MSPVEFVLRVAEATVGAGESPPRSNRGPFVAECLKTTGLGEGYPWCAAYTTRVGLAALQQKWPVIRSASVQQQCEWAAKQNVRLIATKVKAEPGDLFALWDQKLRRWAHIGFVVDVAKDGKTVQTIEGNTSGAGEREGWMVARKTRVLTSKDRLIRWRNLL